MLLPVLCPWAGPGCGPWDPEQAVRAARLLTSGSFGGVHQQQQQCLLMLRPHVLQSSKRTLQDPLVFKRNTMFANVCIFLFSLYSKDSELSSTHWFFAHVASARVEPGQCQELRTQSGSPTRVGKTYVTLDHHLLPPCLQDSKLVQKQSQAH